MINNLIEQFVKMKECDYICAMCKHNKLNSPLEYSTHCEKGERLEGDFIEHITECVAFKFNRAWE